MNVLRISVLKYLWSGGLFLVLFLLSVPATAQLNDFTLNITKTDETCPGNGTLEFSVLNATPNSTFLFTVYKAPELSLPISASSSLTLDGLSSGTYKVIALQTLGVLTNSAEHEIVIDDLIGPLTYDISSTTHDCSTGGEITINTLTGHPDHYEIISGPVLRPLQDSNVFADLPEGTYNVRVFDVCGQATVTTYTLEINLTSPVVSQPILDDEFSGDCDSVTITNSITYEAGTVISYPLDIVYTIHIPGGSPQIVSQHFDSGAPSQLEFSNEFPVIPGQPYTYDIQITNSCGLQYGNTGMTVDPSPAVTYSLSPIPCGKYYLELGISHFNPPYNVEFTQSPDGFVPSAYNGAHPGPFTSTSLMYGNQDLPMPVGNYNVTVTDACGRTGSVAFEIVDDVPTPSASGRNNGCYSLFGRIIVSIPDRQIVFAEIIAAPSTYTQPLPQNVSAFINSGTLIVNNLPLGEYTLHLVDSCGAEYEVTAIVPAFVEQDFSAAATTNCAPGTGSLRVTSGNGALVNLSITAAPAAYTGPADVSGNINASGVLYMSDMPEGNYSFHGTDFCGIVRDVSVNVPAYQPAPGTLYQFEPHCSSFDVQMADPSATSSVKYWLQSENPGVPGEWGHPDTLEAYTEGTLPNSANSIELQNNVDNVNFLYFGHFRIIKAFESFGNGTASRLCLEVLGDFNYYDGVSIENIYNISCLQNADDILVEATGQAPMHYRIERKDGAPFFLNNGTNNIFSGLATGSYEFVVEDGCGHIARRIENISLLPKLADAHDPGRMLICIEPGDPEQAEFTLTDQNLGILDDQSPEAYTVSYHLNAADAEAGVNPLPDNYTNISNPQTIYARLVHNQINICHDVVSFEIRVSEYPQLAMSQDAVICANDGSVVLSADPGFDSYEWSTGETTPDIEVTEPGVYSLIVANIYGDRKCETVLDITVTPSEPPVILGIETADWTVDRNSVTVLVRGNGIYEYSMDNITYQDSPQFDNLETGTYTLYVRDKFGCGMSIYEAYLLNYPKFFTPNGDGINDTWRIPYSVLEPQMDIKIFDRYGKLITGFTPESIGWDGTYNGRPLPSTDYWFVVTRTDGKIHRGHFAMMR